MSETCRVIINQVKQKLHLVGYLLIRYPVYRYPKRKQNSYTSKSVIPFIQLQRKTLILLSAAYLVSVGIVGGTTNIQTIFDIRARILKYVVGYPRHSVSYASFYY